MFRNAPKVYNFPSSSCSNKKHKGPVYPTIAYASQLKENPSELELYITSNVVYNCIFGKDKNNFDHTADVNNETGSLIIGIKVCFIMGGSGISDSL